MRKHPYVHCRGCGKHRSEDGGVLSARGLCKTCADMRRIDNMNQLATRSGPYFDHWARRSFMAARRLVLDELHISP